MIKGERINIIGLKKDALSITYDWINEPELRHGLGTKYPISQYEHEVWFEKASLDKINMSYIIQDKSSRKYIGIIGNRETDMSSRNCTIYLYIGDTEFHGKGIGLEAVNLYSKFLFEQINIRKIQAWIYSYNKNSLKLFEKAGYKLEAVFDKHWFKDGYYHDVNIYYKMCEKNE